jgi:putative inorganic carbon (hco3(-)) transporter
MGLREILVAGIVVALCVVGLAVPRIGIYGYMWFALLRPDILAWAEGPRPYSKMIAICTLAGSVRYITSLQVVLINPISRLLIFLLIFSGFSAFFAVNKDLAVEPYSVYARIVLMALLVPMLCTSLQDVKLLLLVAAFSLGFLGAKFGAGGFFHGGVRYTQGYGGFLGDNNTLALAFAMTVPLCWYARLLLQRKALRVLMMLMAFGSAAGIVWLHSRGGLLALGCTLIVIALRSRYKLLMLVLLPFLILPPMYMVRESYLPRISTIQNYDEDLSALGRLQYWDAAVRMWKDHPIFGVGFGMDNWVELSAPYLGREDYHVVHNNYLQVLVDSGIFAFLILIFLLVGTIIRMEISMRRIRKIQPELEIIPKALQASLIAFAVGSTFLSLVKFDIFYFILMIAAAWWTVYKDLMWRASAGLAPPPPIQVKRPAVAAAARSTQPV